MANKSFNSDRKRGVGEVRVIASRIKGRPGYRVGRRRETGCEHVSRATSSFSGPFKSVAVRRRCSAADGMRL